MARSAFKSLSALAAMLLLASPVAANAQSNESPNHGERHQRLNLMLLGSAPQVCSSMKQDACVSKDWIQANDMRTARLFNLSDVRRREAMRRAVWPRERDDIRDELIETLEMMAEHFGYGVVPEYRLVDRFRSRAHLDLLSRLTEDEYQRVLDGLEMPTLEGLDEVASIEQTEGQSGRLLQRFVTEAGEMGATESPTVYVVTAAQRDPLGGYVSQVAALQAAGAEVKWLPIDATVVQAQANGTCESLDSLRRSTTGAYDRARVHPELHAAQQLFCETPDAWQAMLDEADGIYFTDGDQSRLRQAFINQDREPTELLATIRDKLAAGELAVAAAGNAAIAMSSSTMLTNGTSREGLSEGALSRPAPKLGCDQDGSCPRGVNPNSLTYQAMGGLGLFPFGLLDADVANRGRQGRMLRLAVDTATPLAVGIDRDTAMFVNTEHGVFEVAGDGTVFIVEQATGNEQLIGGTFHLLRNGATGLLGLSQVSRVSLEEQSAFRPESITTRFMDDTGVIDNITRLCEGRDQFELLQDDFRLVMQVSDQSETLGRRGRCQVVNGIVGMARSSLN